MRGLVVFLILLCAASDSAASRGFKARAQRSSVSMAPLANAMSSKKSTEEKVERLNETVVKLKDTVVNLEEDNEAEKTKDRERDKLLQTFEDRLEKSERKPGPPGKDGTNGHNGYNGKQGNPGRDGRDGATGPRGEPGTGIKGDKGDKGDDGLGLTLQPFQIGKTYKEGDYVFHTGRTGGDAMFIAQRSFKAASVPSKDHTNWLQFQAPRGRPGEKGEPGKAGANGEKGEPGKAGAERTGEPGRDGKDGATGPRGEPGTGIKGDKGDKGNDGLGLHLKVFEIGKSYTPGDYVFAKSSQAHHESLYIA